MTAGRNTSESCATDGAIGPPNAIVANPACPRCQCEGIIVHGLWNLSRLSPNSHLVACVIVALWVLGVPVVWTLMSFGESLSGLPPTLAKWDWARCFGLLALGLMFGVPYAVGMIPVSFLICSKCKRIASFCLRRRVPHEWLYMVPRMDSCPRCDYPLRGIADAPRCPECGVAFPPSWRAAV